LRSSNVALESIIGYSLLICVMLALFLEIVGLMLYISAGNSLSISLDQKLSVQEENFFTYTLRTISSAIRSPSYVNLMSLGIAILMFTPYLRAVFSVAYFILAKNYKYTLITSFVLVVITISLMVQ